MADPRTPPLSQWWQLTRLRVVAECQVRTIPVAVVDAVPDVDAVVDLPTVAVAAVLSVALDAAVPLDPTAPAEVEDPAPVVAAAAWFNNA